MSVMGQSALMNALVGMDMVWYGMPSHMSSSGATQSCLRGVTSPCSLWIQSIFWGEAQLTYLHRPRFANPIKGAGVGLQRSFAETPKPVRSPCRGHLS